MAAMLQGWEGNRIWHHTGHASQTQWCTHLQAQWPMTGSRVVVVQTLSNNSLIKRVFFAITITVTVLSSDLHALHTTD